MRRVHTATNKTRLSSRLLTRSRGLRLLSIGFASTAAMWVYSYLALLQPGFVLGEVLFAMAVLSLLYGGMLSSRLDLGANMGRGFVEGMCVGLIAAALNLLLVASLLKSDMVAGKLWIGGILVGCVLTGGFGGALGGMLKPKQTTGAWVSIFCWVAAGVTFFMIITGGIVTGFEAGLAVPDWPGSFGHNMLLYPLSEMVADLNSGIYFEHAHRLTGMFVGITAIVLCIVILKFDNRLWTRLLGVLVLLLVIGQGVMGGLRVTDLNIPLAIVHGVVAQVILAMMAALAVTTSRRWLHPRDNDRLTASKAEWTVACVLVVVLLVQLGIGAAYRHLVSELGPRDGGAMALLMGHITLAVVVVVIAVVAGIQASHHKGVLRAVGILLLALVGLQLLLGVGALVTILVGSPKVDTKPLDSSGQSAIVAGEDAGEGTTDTEQADASGLSVDVAAEDADAPGVQAERISTLEVVVTSAHQANGAFLLMTATVCALWTRRLRAATHDEPSTAPAA